MSDGLASARGWYGGLLAGLLPILLLGFIYSALADRTAFALWALVAGALWIVLLRQGFAVGWPARRRTGSLLLLLAVAFAIFARLEFVHHEILDLGFRAVFPAVYHPLATQPGTVGVLAAMLAIAGAALLVLGLTRKDNRKDKETA